MPQFAFVLLDDSPALNPGRLAAAMNRAWKPVVKLEKERWSLLGLLRSLRRGPKPEVLTFSVGHVASLMVVGMPMAVPDGEAEAAAECSMSAVGTDWTLKPHRTHLMVAVHEDNREPVMERMLRFTRLLSGVLDGVDGAVGVYWGNAGATHSVEFFRNVAMKEDVLPVMLWNGISVAREGERLSLLSLGMNQFDMPNLRLTSPPDSGSDAMEYFMDLLAYAIRRGSPPADGDTIGRTEHEKLRVNYEPSPLDEAERVWCVDLPA